MGQGTGTVPNAGTAGTPGAVPPDIEDGGNLLEPLRLTRGCAGEAGRLPGPVQPDPSALGPAAIRRRRSGNSSASVPGSGGHRDPTVAAVGTG